MMTNVITAVTHSNSPGYLKYPCQMVPRISEDFSNLKISISPSPSREDLNDNKVHKTFILCLKKLLLQYQRDYWSTVWTCEHQETVSAKITVRETARPPPTIPSGGVTLHKARRQMKSVGNVLSPLTGLFMNNNTHTNRTARDSPKQRSHLHRS